LSITIKLAQHLSSSQPLLPLTIAATLFHSHQHTIHSSASTSRSNRAFGTQKLNEHHAQLNNKFQAFAVAVVLLALPSIMMTFNYQII
jgi:hypothetical protein